MFIIPSELVGWQEGHPACTKSCTSSPQRLFFEWPNFEYCFVCLCSSLHSQPHPYLPSTRFSTSAPGERGR